MKQDSTNGITYLLVTIGSITERGGRVITATGRSAIAGLDVARVGDVVTYADGSEAVVNDSPDRQDHAVAFVPARSDISVH